MENKEKPVVVFTGENGNVFNLLAICTDTLKKAKMKKQAKELVNRAWKCESYEEVLSLMEEYVTIK